MMGRPAFKVLSDCDYFELPDEVVVWTQQEFDILQTLAIHVRMLTAPQAARIWSRNDKSVANALGSLLRLAKAGLLERYTVNAHPLLEPKRPLASWTPNQPDLDSRTLSAKAKARWNRPAEPTEVFVASKQAANLFGGDPHGLPPVEHRDHDLLLSDAYAVHRSRALEDALQWIGEDFLPKAGFRIKDPDAFLVDADGHPKWVIESGGRYSPRQIESFHDHCLSLSLPYELW